MNFDPNLNLKVNWKLNYEVCTDKASCRIQQIQLSYNLILAAAAEFLCIKPAAYFYLNVCAYTCKVFCACTLPTPLILQVLFLQFGLFYCTLFLSVLSQHGLSAVIYLRKPLSYPTLLVFLHFTSCLSSPLTLSFHSIPHTATFYHREKQQRTSKQWVPPQDIVSDFSKLYELYLLWMTAKVKINQREVVLIGCEHNHPQVFQPLEMELSEIYCQLFILMTKSLLLQHLFMMCLSSSAVTA